MKIQLGQDELAELRKPINGTGGFQSFLKQLRQRSAIGGRLELSQEDLEKIRRYAFEYRDGGYEGRLRLMFERTLGKNLNGFPD